MLDKLLSLTESLEKNQIHYRLNKVRPGFIMIEIAVPGERWEVEVAEDGSVEIEKFKRDGVLYDESEWETLLSDFSR